VSPRDCEACEERLPDLVDGSLGPVMAGEVRRHLESCAACSSLHAALVAVTAELRRHRPASTDDARLAAAVAARSFRRKRRAADLWPLAPERGGPPWRIQIASGVLSLAVTGAVFVFSSVAHGAGSAPLRALRSVNESATDFRSRTDSWMEDIRLVRVLVATAFEGRLDRVQEQVEDYRRLLERRRRAVQPTASPVPNHRTPGASST
jgi:anti-sigma factor RsiW